jgi:hypothetical protein
MSATSDYRDAVLTELVVFAERSLEGLNGDEWRLIYAWWSNEGKRLFDLLSGDEELVTEHSLPVVLSDLLTMGDYLTFNELAEGVNSVGGDAHDYVVHLAQKVGAVPVTESITKAEFDRYQRVMATFPIRMDDENGVDGIAVWNDEKSIRNGNRVLLLSNREIKGIKAAIQ